MLTGKLTEFSSVTNRYKDNIPKSITHAVLNNLLKTGTKLYVQLATKIVCAVILALLSEDLTT